MNTLVKLKRTSLISSLIATGYLLTNVTDANAVNLRVSVTNLAPDNGTLLTPLWIGFHDGNFDIYNGGESLNGFPGTESLVEDGVTSGISQRFIDEGVGQIESTIIGPLGANPGPIDSGETATFIINNVDPNSLSNRYFSYASMVIPSNDAFIANGNPLAHEIFDESGNFIGADIIELGSDVLDGGTEVNDELPANTAFFGQQTPNTGVDENGVVTPHPGFNPVGSGGILDAPSFTNADFTTPGYQVARIQVEQVQAIPEPMTILGSLVVGGGLLFKRKFKGKI